LQKKNWKEEKNCEKLKVNVCIIAK
jgi:hypothetical protein